MISALTPFRARMGRLPAYAALLPLLAALFSLAVAAPASATTTIGQLFSPAYTSCGAGTALQTGVASGTSYTVPVPGVITSWSYETNSAVVPGLELKVAQPGGANEYTVVGQSLAGSETANSINTYPANIPVQPGDVIGYYEGGGGCYTDTGLAGDTYAWVSTTNEPLGTATYNTYGEGLFPVSAVITSPPTASTTAASGVEESNAILNGSVGPEEARTAYFQYGTSAAYGASTSHQSIGSSGSATALSATVSGLSPGTTYHFRLAAENAGGVSYGADQTFTTPAASAAPSVPPTSPPVERGKPLVNSKTGEVTTEYEFPESGEAQQEVQVVNGASLASLQGIAPVDLGDPLATFAAKHKGAKRCKTGYVKKGKRCASNGPVVYGRASLTVAMPGVGKLGIKPSAKVLANLKRGKTLNLRLTLTFTPAGTTDNIRETATIQAHLKLKKGHRGRHGK